MKIVVVAGGDPIGERVFDLPADAFVIAADSGVDRALRAGLHVDVAIGDFDSVSPEGFERAEKEGARVERHPAAKDATDLELALDEAVRLGATDVVVVGVGGGPRLDHLIANVLVLASPRFAACNITALSDAARVHVIRPGTCATNLAGTVHDLVTLLPVGGDAGGVTTTGLLYPLTDEPLHAGSTRGVSNVIESLPAAVQLRDGTLLAILPGQGVEDA